MDPESPKAIEQAVEVLHAGRATVVGTVPLRERFDDGAVWEGPVHVIDLVGNTRASRAYAWFSPEGGAGERRFFVALHMWKINSPSAAVRDAMGPSHGIVRKG
jgi:hypothetical protein